MITDQMRTAALRLRVPAWVTTMWQQMTRIERSVSALLLILLVASGAWSMASFIGRHTELVPQAGGTYREAAVGQPRYLNPILAGANDVDVDISQLVYSGLFKLDANLQLQNDLATGYELSADNVEYKVSLRQDVQWHDHEPFTADDVVFTISSIQTPDYASPLASSFQGVTVEKIDDYTVLFKLKQPYAPFLTSLTVGIVPEHVWESVAPRNATLAEQVLKPVGTGPYSFDEIKTRRKTGDITELRLVKNENYYGPKQYLDKIVFSFYPQHEDAIAALQRGSVDGVAFLPLKLRDDVAKRRSLTIHHVRLPQYFALFFNQSANKALADAGIRTALELATDRNRIVHEALQDEADVVYLPIPPGLLAYNEELAQPPYNPEQARKNLEEAGWQDTDGDGIREKDGQRLHFTITTTDWPDYVRTAEIIQQQWREVGAETEIKHFGPGTIQQSVISPREYEILLFGEILPADPDPYPFWHSSQAKSPGLNFSQFKNEAVDKLLEEARKTIDPIKRTELYRDFQGKILDLKPALVLFRPHYLFATTAKVRGVEANHAAKTSNRFNNIEHWHVRVQRVWK